MGIRVTNRSEWPDWLVRWIVRRACQDAGITEYEWTMKSCGQSRCWWGRGGSRHGRGGVARRVWEAKTAMRRIVDPRYQDYGVWVPHTPVAVLAFIIRHEVAHARGAEGHPSDFRVQGGTRRRIRRADMEDICNDAGGRFVSWMSDHWPEIRAEWRRLAKAARPPKVNRTKFTRDKHAASLARWQGKLRLAQAKVTKYRRLLASTERRLAATSGR